MHAEQISAVIGAVFVFTKIVGAIKAILFVKDVASKVAYDDREDYIKAHIFEEHGHPLKWCHVNQCASL